MVMNSKSKCEFSLIVPVYNEESNVLPFLKRTSEVMQDITDNYEVIFCMDPCSDRTEEIILSARNLDSRIKYAKFSRRFGQPSATLAGLHLSSGLVVGVIDIDLQDPPELLIQMFKKMREGYDVVYATREKRDGETIFKKIFSQIGYKAINSLSEIEIPVNTGDFRIMSRRVVDEICSLKEMHGFLRGLVAYVGFPQTGIKYKRDSRGSGKSKYNKYFGSLRIGLNGLMGFSVRPLSYMTFIGVTVSSFSFILGIWYGLQHFIGFDLTPGLSSTIIVVSFLGGVQLLSIGILGEYIGRIYEEVRNRPKFIIEKSTGFEKE